MASAMPSPTRITMFMFSRPHEFFSVLSRLRPRVAATRIEARLVAPLLLALIAACAPSKPPATTSDFVRRHSCPESLVETTEEGPDRIRVSGCGKSEVFGWRCSNVGSAPPMAPKHAPLTESEARFPSGPSGPNETGCAWSRERQPEPSTSPSD